MSTSKHIAIICIVATVLALAFTCAALLAGATGAFGTAQGREMGYEEKLFDTSVVHTIDIEMDDWDEFIASAQSEEYAPCSITIDGEKFDTVGIRGKGNTSLRTVASLDSSRYSFKVEFGHYSGGVSYHGLDKISLNNTIQDTTYMKDYLTYRAMASFGVSAPLCSYAWITANGEDWGLYLVVEGVEESFLQRNYGSGYGELYKPDSMSFGGGRGNGAGFDMGNFDFDESGELKILDENGEEVDLSEFEGKMPYMGNMPQAPPDGSMPDFNSSNMPDFGSGNMPQAPSGGDATQSSTGSDTSGTDDASQAASDGSAPKSPTDGKTRERPDAGSSFGGGPGGGMGSNDVKLQYIDDNASSYSNIFDNAKTAASDGDKSRLIASLKQLSSYENLEDVVNTDEVIRYFVVHDYVCNGDSYTGAMVHNYYLYEKDGTLSMIPWDYNLAFGTFQASSDATSTVNSPIDTPVSNGSMDDRPMVDWIFSNEEYTNRYHALYAEFLQDVDLQALIDETEALIAPYVQKDPTAFYTYEEFEAGVAALKSFCTLRSESVAGQLTSAIPSTKDAQANDSSALVDGSSLDLGDMGSMEGEGGGMPMPGGMPGNGGGPSSAPGGMPGNNGPGGMPPKSSA